MPPYWGIFSASGGKLKGKEGSLRLCMQALLFSHVKQCTVCLYVCIFTLQKTCSDVFVVWVYVGVHTSILVCRFPFIQVPLVMFFHQLIAPTVHMLCSSWRI